MPSPCTVCARPDRADIDCRFAREHVNLSKLADSLGVGRKSLERHRNHHLPPRPTFTEVVNASKPPLRGDLARAFHLALEALARAESATLMRMDPTRYPHATPSPAATVACIREARHHMGTVARLVLESIQTKELATQTLLDRMQAVLSRTTLPQD